MAAMAVRLASGGMVMRSLCPATLREPGKGWQAPS